MTKNIATIFFLALIVSNVSHSVRNCDLRNACKKGRLSLVRRHLQNGADPSSQSRLGATCLELAAQFGHDHVIKHVANFYRDKSRLINKKNFAGWTPLHMAARQNFTQTIRTLRKNGARLNSVDRGGWTPLHLAAHYGNLEAAKLLLKLGADATLENDAKQTAQMIAKRKGYIQIAELIGQD